METAVSVLGAVETLKDSLVLVELPLLNRDIDADDVLPHDATSTDVEVTWDVRENESGAEAGMKRHSPDLRVSHEPIAETNSKPVRGKPADTVVLGDGVHVGRGSGVDRVSLHALLGRDAPAIVDAVHDDERAWRAGKWLWANMRQTLFLTSTMVDREEEAMAALGQTVGRVSRRVLAQPRRVVRLKPQITSSHLILSSPSPFI